jgi:hypothetical protein
MSILYTIIIPVVGYVQRLGFSKAKIRLQIDLPSRALRVKAQGLCVSCVGTCCVVRYYRVSRLRGIAMLMTTRIQNGVSTPVPLHCVDWADPSHRHQRFGLFLAGTRVFVLTLLAGPYTRSSKRNFFFHLSQLAHYEFFLNCLPRTVAVEHHKAASKQNHLHIYTFLPTGWIL